MKHPTTLITIILFALFTLGYSNAIAQGGPPEEPPRKGNFRKEMKEKLNLSADQEKQFKDIHFKFAKDRIQARATMQTKRLEVKQLLDADKPDRAGLEKKFNEIADLEVQQKLLGFDQAMEMKKVLTPEQQKIFKELKEDLPHPQRQGMRERIRERIIER